MKLTGAHPALASHKRLAARRQLIRGVRGQENQMAKSSIKAISTPFLEVVAVLQSPSLTRVEEGIAAAIGKPILREYSSVYVSPTQAAMSVSGMSPTQIQKFLDEHQDALITFGIRFAQDADATKEEEEYPEGEEPDDEDEDSNSVSLGMGTGFGVIYAIYYNFLANRTPEDFREYLKNRRIPYHAKFAKELRRVFDEAKAG
jgi:hypothetical protein